MDAARTALRMGGGQGDGSLPPLYGRASARKEEVENAIEEGIEMTLLTNPVEILGDKKVEGIKCNKMQLGQPDEGAGQHPYP